MQNLKIFYLPFSFFCVWGEGQLLKDVFHQTWEQTNKEVDRKSRKQGIQSNQEKKEIFRMV